MADVRLYQILKLSRDAIILKSATKNSFEHIMLNIYHRTSDCCNRNTELELEPIKEKIANNSTQSVGRLVPFVDDIVAYLF